MSSHRFAFIGSTSARVMHSSREYSKYTGHNPCCKYSCCSKSRLNSTGSCFVSYVGSAMVAADVGTRLALLQYSVADLDKHAPLVVDYLFSHSCARGSAWASRQRLLYIVVSRRTRYQKLGSLASLNSQMITIMCTLHDSTCVYITVCST